MQKGLCVPQNFKSLFEKLLNHIFTLVYNYYKYVIRIYEHTFVIAEVFM